jgi:MFS family permease
LTLLQRRWFPILLGHAFLLRVGMTYDALSIGLDAFWIGLIGGAFGVVPALFGLYAGRLIDRLGEGRMLAIGSALALVAAAGLWLAAPSAGELILLSAVAGIAQFVCIATQHSSVGKASGLRQAANFGHLTMMISVAHMIGPVVFGTIANRQSLPDTGPVYLVAVLLSLLLLAVGLCLRVPRLAPSPQTQSIWRTARAILRTPGFLPAAFASLVLFSAMDLLVIYLPLFGAEQGISAAGVGILLSLRGAASMVSRLFFGKLYAAIGRGVLLVLSLAVAGTAVALLPFVDTLAAMGALAVVAGLGLGIGAPLSLSWIAEIIEPRVLGSALALRLALNRGGQVILPIAVGAAASGLGASAIIVAIGGSLLAAAGISAIVSRGR